MERPSYWKEIEKALSAVASGDQNTVEFHLEREGKTVSVFVASERAAGVIDLALTMTFGNRESHD